MIKPLRKRHLQIWATLAVLLPLGIVLSWLVIPNPVPVKILSIPTARLLPLIRAEKDNSQYCSSIRTDKDESQWQLVWTNKLALTVPSAVIYKISPNEYKPGIAGSFKPGKGTLVGRIEARGSYVFPLKMDSIQNNLLHILLYDFIHEKIIDTINFNITTSPPGEVSRR